jgi:O-antigen ligase
MYDWIMLKHPQNMIRPEKLSLVFLLGVPLVTLILDIELNDPFNVPKLIVLILISSWLAINLCNSYLNYRFKRGTTEYIFSLLVALFLIAQFVVIFFGNDMFVSLFGDTQRKNGFVGYLGLGVLFLYALRSIRHSNVERFLAAFIIAGWVVVAYGVLQINGEDFVQWVNPYNSAITTLGNPNFTSAFLAMFFVSSLLLTFTGKAKRFYRVQALIMVPLSLYVILSSESRQGLYAIVCGLLFFLVSYFYAINSKFKYVIASIVLLAVGVSILGMLQIGPLASLLYKPSVTVRGFYWRAALEMFSSKPLTGVGLDSYGDYFRQYKEIGYVRNYGVEITSNNAHNTFLQLLATGGFFVGALYLLLILGVIYFGLRSVFAAKKTPASNLILTLLAAFVTFQAQSFISIDNLGISVWSWCFAGAILGISTEVKSEGQPPSKESPVKKPKNGTNLLTPIIRFLVLVPVILVCVLIYRPESEMYFLRGIADPRYPDNKPSVYEYSYKIINNPLADPELKLKSILYLGDFGYADEARLNLESLLKSNPESFEYLWSKAVFQMQRNDLSGAVNSRLQISKVDPLNHKNYLELLKLYRSMGNINDALNMQVKIEIIDPKSDSADIARTLNTQS